MKIINLIDIIPSSLLQKIEEAEIAYKKTPAFKLLSFNIDKKIAYIILFVLFFIAPILFIGLIIGYALVFKFDVFNGKAIETNFKNEIISSVFKEYYKDKQSTFEPGCFLPKSDLLKSGILSASDEIDRYKGEDLMTFKTESSSLQMSEIEAVDISRSRKSKSYNTLAKGLLGKISSSNPFLSSSNNIIKFSFTKKSVLEYPLIQLLFAIDIFGIFFLPIINILLNISRYNSFGALLNAYNEFLNINYLILAALLAIILFYSFISTHYYHQLKVNNPLFDKVWTISKSNYTELSEDDNSMIHNLDFQNKLLDLGNDLKFLKVKEFDLLLHTNEAFFYSKELNLFVPFISKENPTILKCIETDIRIIDTLIELSEFLAKYKK